MITEKFLKKRDRVLKFLGNKPYLSLGICILLSSVLLYWQYIFGNSTLVFFDVVGGDTHHSYIPAYNFFASSIKNGELSSYTFQYGYGNSIFSMINIASDPFSMIGVLIGVLFGEQYIADSMIYILIAKHICAGLLCLYFLKGFNFSERSSMISAYIYAFSGYIMTLGNHYFFATSPVYFVLLLIILEKTIKGKHRIRNWIGLVAIVALVTANNLVTAYEMLLGAGFYTLLRVIYIYGKDVKKIMQRLGISLAFVISGVCIASFILFPVMGKVAGSDRLIHPNDYFSLNAFDNIKSAVLKLFSNNLEGTPAGWYGGSGTFAYYSHCFPCFFTVMLVPMAAQFIWRTFKKDYSIKEKIFRMIPVAIVIFAITDKFIPYLFSFFVPSSYHSYVYIFLPLYAMLFTDVLDNARLGKFSRTVNYVTMIVSLAIIVWGAITTYNEGSQPTLMWMIFPGVMLVMGCFAIDILFLSSKKTEHSPSHNRIEKVASVALTAIFALNLFGENLITVNYSRNPISREQEHTPMLIDNVAENINALEKDNFFRFETTYSDGIMMGYTYPLLFPIRSTGYYDSSLDNGVPEFYLKMFNYANHNMIDYGNGCAAFLNTIIEDVLGIKYLLRTTEFHRNGWEKVEEYTEKDAYLYKNSGVNSAGLLFDSYITQEEADTMSFNERAFGMAERLIIDSPSQNINDYAAEYSSQTPSNQENFVFDINGVQGYEGSVNTTISGNECSVSAQLEGDGSNVNFALNTEIINDSRNASQITFRLKNSDVVKDFVYCDSDTVWKSIPRLNPIIDGEDTIYTFIIPQTALGLALCVNQPCTLDFSVSSKTVTASYINEGIHLDNPKRGNIIVGTVEAGKNSLLYLPVPYDEFWNAYVDGEKVEILKANYAFIAIPVSAGEHRVELIYSNELYHLGLTLSVAVSVILAVFFTIYFLLGKRKKGGI